MSSYIYNIGYSELYVLTNDVDLVSLFIMLAANDNRDDR
jgi:hypothetical protein